MANKKFLDFEGVRHLWSKINMQDYPNNDMLMNVIQAIDDTKADRDELLQNANLTDAEAYDLRYKLRLPDTKQFYYVGDMSSGTDFVSGFMCSLKEEQVEKAKSIPAVHYPNIHPNALSELISSCNMAMGKGTSSINYKIILPRIIDNFEKLYENEVITSSFLEISFYEITKYTGQIGSLAEMSLLKQGDESFLLYRRPDMGFLNFKGNVVLENHMATLDTTLTDPYIPPSSEAVGVALDLKADRNELLQNKEEITNQESYELQFKLRLPSVKEYVYTGDNTSGVSPTGSMCSKFSGIEQAMGVPAAYSSTAPNALAELIGGCMAACSNTPDSMTYNNILPRITLNFPNLVAAGAWSSGILLTTYSISDYSRTTGDKITFFIKYDSETDEYTLQRRSPSWGVLVFNSQNVVLLNQMSKFDDTLTDPNRGPSAAGVGEALKNKVEKEDLVQPDWDVVDSTSLAYIKNRTHERHRMIPDCQNTTIPELGYTPLNTWPSDIYETEAYNSFITLSSLYGIMGGGSTTRRYDFSFTIGNGVTIMDYSYKGDKIQANAIMLDEDNYKCNIATNGSLALFFINNLEALSDEYKDTFNQPGIYLYCSSENYKAGMRNIHSMVYNYAHLDTDYLSPLPEYLIPSEIARAETVVTHTSNKAIHVTAEEKEAWNNMMNTLGQNLILTDSVTGINYLITIVNGKLTLQEVE